MRQRAILDGVFISEPKGFDRVDTTIQRDKEKIGIVKDKQVLLTYPTTSLEGKYILDKFYGIGHCKELTCDLQDFINSTWKTYHKGLIKLADCKILWRSNEIECKVIDNNYSSRIDNNKNIDIYSHAETSKNGIAITPAEQYRITVFKPSDGSLFTPQDTHGLTGHRVFEVLRHLVESMSDNEMEFESTLFDVGGDLEGFAMMSAKTLRFGKAVGYIEEDWLNDQLKISWDKLLKSLHKKFNLGWIIDTTGTKPVLKLERRSELFSSEVSDFKFENIGGKYEEYFDKNSLYSSIKLGTKHLNESEVDADPLSYPSNADWTGFKIESWILEGQCNQDLPLDLSDEEFVYDTNVIEDILGFDASGAVGNGNTNYDDQWVFLETEYSDPNTGSAVLGDPEGAAPPPPYIYNPNLRNHIIAQNHLEGIPNSVIQILNNNTGGLFRAQKADNVAINNFDPAFWPPNGQIIAQIDTPPVNFDDGNNYNNVTGDYVVPSNGQYTFSIKHVNFNLLGGNPAMPFPRLDLVIKKFNAGLTEIGSQGTFFWGANQIFNNENSFTTTYICNATDIIKFYLYFQGNPVNSPNGPIFVEWKAGTVLECSSINRASGELVASDPKNFKGVIHDFSFPIPVEEFKKIEDSPVKQFYFNREGHPKRIAHINKISHDGKMANVSLVSSLNQNPTFNGT